MTPEKLAQLRAPFDKKHIGKLPKVYCTTCTSKNVECKEHDKKKCSTCKAFVSPAHLHVDFVGHAHVTERLLDVDPEWNWEPMAFSGNGLPQIDDRGGLWIRLTVAGVTRVGYGDGAGPEAVKIAISDAIKNAAMRFGVALDLWKKEAPEPVAADPERPTTEQATLTPAQRCTELRKLISAVGLKIGRDIDRLGKDYHQSTKGREISTERTPRELEKFLELVKAAAALHEAIYGIGAAAGKDKKAVAAEFYVWTEGKIEFGDASNVILVQYRDVLERGAA